MVMESHQGAHLPDNQQNNEKSNPQSIVKKNVFEFLGLYTVWLVLIFSLSLTVLMWWSAKDKLITDQVEKFNRRTNEITFNIQKRAQEYEQVLRGGLGFFNASEQVTRTEWTNYVEALKLEERFPGIQRFGYAEYVTSLKREAHVKKMRAEGLADYDIRPPGDRLEYVLLTYLEPSNQSSRKNIGVDILKDPVRGAALERARDTGKSSITGLVQLLNKVDNKRNQPGMLMFIPDYKNGLPQSTLEERRSNLNGYILGAIRFHDFMHGIMDEKLSGRAVSDLDIEIYDGTIKSIPSLLYDDDNVPHAFEKESGRVFSRSVPITLYGHTWTLYYTAHPEFYKDFDENKPLLILIVGIVISALFTGVFLLFVRRRQSAERMADAMSFEARKTAAKIQAILNTVVDGIVTINHAGVIDTFNAAAEKIFGYSANEVIGKNVKCLMPEPFRSEHDGYLQSHHDGGGSKVIGIIKRELTGRHKDGSIFPMELAVSESAVDNKKGFTGIIRNITERKQTEKIQAQFAAIIASSTDAIMSKNLDGIVTSWNAAAEKMFGYTEDEMIGQPMAILIPLERKEEEFEILAKIRQGQQIEHFETVRRKKNGEFFPISVNISPILNTSGVVIGASKIVRDISDLKKRQELLVEATHKAEKANLAKSEFLANMSHEIRTPLNAVLGIAHLLANTALSQTQKEQVNIIRSSGQSLLSILNDILDFSKIEAGKMEVCPFEFNLDDVLNGVASIMTINSINKKLELVVGMEDDVPRTLIGDSLRIQQILINLSGNAIKFTEQGEVVVGVSLIEQQGDSVILRFQVKDSGIGMTAVQMASLFSAFSQADTSITRRFGGTGLGLAISKRLVNLMGGEIGVSSEAGKGSLFWFTLPLKLVKRDNFPIDKSMNGNLTVLIVDDNAASCAFLQKRIKSFGWQSESAASGEQAVAMFQIRQKQDAPYDIVLIDWDMPGMDGLAAIRKIRALYADAKAVLMVNSHSKELLPQAELDELMLPLIVKPANASTLFDSLSGQLTSATDSASLGRVEVQDTRVLEGVRLLLVEDNPFNQIVARGLLEQAGATLDVAGDGQQAVDILRVTAHRYDIVLMDVQMPVMDGFAATRVIRNELKLTLPVIAMTAGVMASEREQCINAGMVDFIGKPIVVKQMLETILRHLPRQFTSSKGEMMPQEIFEKPEALIDEIGFGAAVDQLLSALGDEAKNGIIDYIDRIVKNGIGPIEDARQAWETGRMEDAARIFHTLRGSLGMLGAHELQKVASKMEEAILATDIKEVDALFLMAEHEMMRVVSAALLWQRNRR